MGFAKYRGFRTFAGLWCKTVRISGGLS